MASSQQAAANKANARRSTGPRSVAGKARSRVNALKHGLAIPASALPELAPEIARLTHILAGPAADHPAVRQAATRVAEAVLDVVRVRQARAALVDRLFRERHDPYPCAPMPPKRSRSTGTGTSSGLGGQASSNGPLQAVGPMEAAQIRQESEADAEGSGVRRRGAETAQPAMEWTSAWDLLGKLDRYERRALSRRHTAINAFEAACSAACPPRPAVHGNLAERTQ